MNINRQSTINVEIISLSGRFDNAAVPEFKRQVHQGVQYADYVIELSEVDYIDSGGLGSLVSLLRLAQKRNGDVKIACVPDKINYAFELTKLHRIFDMFDDTTSAVKSFSKSATS